MDQSAGGNVSIAIFVVAPTGEIIDSHSMDGVLPIGRETGLLKAKTALREVVVTRSRRASTTWTAG